MRTRPLFLAALSLCWGSAAGAEDAPARVALTTTAGVGPAIAVISKVNSLTIINIIVDRGACTAYANRNRSVYLYDKANYDINPKTILGFGQKQIFTVLDPDRPFDRDGPNPCSRDIIEIAIYTDHGSWTLSPE